MNSSPPHPKTIDLVVCYIRMCIPGPFSSSSLIFLLDYVILFFFCVCASTTSLLFVAIFAMNFVFAHLITPLPTHPPLHLIFKMIL